MYVEACARFARAHEGARDRHTHARRGGAQSFAALIPTLLAGLTLGLACGASVRPGGDSGSTDGPSTEVTPTDLSPSDASVEVVARPVNCRVTSPICVGKEVHACVPGVTGELMPGELIEACDGPCSYGRCVSAACFEAEQNDPMRGCRFYPVQVDNVDADDAKNMMLILTNSSPFPANASLQVRLADGTWGTSAAVMVPARASARLEANRAMRDAGITRMGAFRLDADGPISVVQLVSDDVDRASTSSGGTVLRPVHALDSFYWAVSYQQVSSSKIAATPGGRGGAGMIVVVATADRTTVTVRSAASLLVDPVTTLPGAAGPYSALLDEGDVLQIFSAAPDGNLTGTRVDADHPVEVFSGNVLTGYNFEVSGLNGADLAFEQLPPVKGWNTTYVGAWLAPQDGCDPYFGTGLGSWQVIAARDDTWVTISPSASMAEEPMFRLNAGMTKQFTTRFRPEVVDAGGPFLPTDFVVTSAMDHPILLVQWLDCEPALALGIDGRLISSWQGEGPPPAGPPPSRPQEVVVAFPPGFDHQLVIVRRAGSQVWFDGVLIGDEQFHSISPLHPFEVARYSGEQLGQCIDLSDGCSHVIRGDQMGVTWRGMDVVCSYAATLPSTSLCQLAGVPCVP